MQSFLDDQIAFDVYLPSTPHDFLLGGTGMSYTHYLGFNPHSNKDSETIETKMEQQKERNRRQLLGAAGGHSHGSAADGGGNNNKGKAEILLEKREDYFVKKRNPSCFLEACAYGNLHAVVLLYAQGAVDLDENEPEDLQRLREDIQGLYHHLNTNTNPDGSPHRQSRYFYEASDASPLMWAAFRRHLPVVRFLLSKNMNINFANALGHTALQWAMLGGDLDIYLAVLRHNTLPYHHENTAQYHLFGQQQNNNNNSSSNQKTNTHRAHPDRNAAAYNIVDLYRKDKQGFDAAFVACQSGNFAYLLFLLDDAMHDGILPDLQEMIATSPFQHHHHNTKNNNNNGEGIPINPRTLQPYYLLDPAQRDVEGHTLLHWVAYRDCPMLLTFLLSYQSPFAAAAGAATTAAAPHAQPCFDPNAKDYNGRTALMWAAREGFADVCEVLLLHGADATIRDASEGKTALQYAEERRHPETARVLKELGRVAAGLYHHNNNNNNNNNSNNNITTVAENEDEMRALVNNNNLVHQYSLLESTDPLQLPLLPASHLAKLTRRWQPVLASLPSLRRAAAYGRKIAASRLALRLWAVLRAVATVLLALSGITAAARRLRRYRPVREKRRGGTLHQMLTDFYFFNLFIFAILYSLLVLVCVRYLPPSLSFFPFGLYFFKNAVWHVCYGGAPIRGADGAKNKKGMAMPLDPFTAGLAKNFMESVRGTVFTRYRDFGSMIVVLFVLFLQIRFYMLFHPDLSRNSVYPFFLHTPLEEVQQASHVRAKYHHNIYAFTHTKLSVKKRIASGVKVRENYENAYNNDSNFFLLHGFAGIFEWMGSEVPNVDALKMVPPCLFALTLFFLLLTKMFAMSSVVVQRHTARGGAPLPSQTPPLKNGSPAPPPPPPQQPLQKKSSQKGSEAASLMQRLRSSPVGQLVRRRRHLSLLKHERAYLPEKNMVMPLRAFYCFERDVVIDKYDGYSNLLDCPVGRKNHLFFVLFWLALFLYELVILSWTYGLYREKLLCDYNFDDRLHNNFQMNKAANVYENEQRELKNRYNPSHMFNDSTVWRYDTQRGRYHRRSFKNYFNEMRYNDVPATYKEPYSTYTNFSADRLVEARSAAYAQPFYGGALLGLHDALYLDLLLQENTPSQLFTTPNLLLNVRQPNPYGRAGFPPLLLKLNEGLKWLLDWTANDALREEEDNLYSPNWETVRSAQTAAEDSHGGGGDKRADDKNQKKIEEEEAITGTSHPPGVLAPVYALTQTINQLLSVPRMKRRANTLMHLYFRGTPCTSFRYYQDVIMLYIYEYKRTVYEANRPDHKKGASGGEDITLETPWDKLPGSLRWKLRILRLRFLYRYYLKTDLAGVGGVLNIHFSFLILCATATVLWRQLRGIWSGATRVEMANPLAPGPDGQLVYIFPDETKNAYYAQTFFPKWHREKLRAQRLQEQPLQPHRLEEGHSTLLQHEVDVVAADSHVFKAQVCEIKDFDVEYYYKSIDPAKANELPISGDHVCLYSANFNNNLPYLQRTVYSSSGAIFPFAWVWHNVVRGGMTNMFKFFFCFNDCRSRWNGAWSVDENNNPCYVPPFDDLTS